MKETLQKHLNTYANLKKGLAKTIKPLAKTSLALGGAFLAGMPIVEGTIITGTVGHTQGTGADFSLNIDGGVDLKFQVQGSGPAGSYRIAMSGPGVDGFIGSKVGNYAYPAALTSGGSIGGAVVEGAGALNTLANEKYNGGAWLGLSDGTTRFVGFKLTSGNYGWVRITKNSDRSITIVDWAYQDDGSVINPISASLPVVMTRFGANAQDESIQLMWETASELNNSGFEVQRSTNGENYETLAFVEGHGTSLVSHEYFYDDKELRKDQQYYYRLKQIEMDGRFEYSSIVIAQINTEQQEVKAFYPNPTTGPTQLEYTSSVTTDLRVTVYNITGQELRSEVQSVAEGTNFLAFDFSALGKGNYFIKLEAGTARHYQKLVIQ